MVPVENAAGGAAAVFHKPYPEGAPEKHADKVADIKSNAYEQEHSSADNAGEIEGADDAVEDYPDQTHKNGVFIGLDYKTDKFFVAAQHIILEGLEGAFEKLLRARGPISFGGDKLHYHVHHPDHPHNVEKAEAVKDMEAVHNIKLPGRENKQQSAYYKNRAAEYKPLASVDKTTSST